MTKADELWEKYARNGLTEIGKVDFLDALAEYGDAVRAEAVKVCEKIDDEIGPANETNWGSVCAAAIEKMKLP